MFTHQFVFAQYSEFVLIHNQAFLHRWSIINIMTTFTAVWLCLITHVVYGTVIIVNNNGDNSTNCCVIGTCPCSSLSSALHDVSDNTVINITSESVTLHDIVGMGTGNLNNITITGNGATIMCNNTGGVYCESCSDITIFEITWYQCGRNDSQHPFTPIPAVAFTKVSLGIAIFSCTFNSSSGCPVYVENLRGNILIMKSHFLQDTYNFLYHDVHYDMFCGGLYISSNTQNDTEGAISTITISFTTFVTNGNALSIYYR